MTPETVSAEYSERGSSNRTSHLLGAFAVNQRLSQAYGVHRFLKSPGMQELSSGFSESIAEHMWRAALLWDNSVELLPGLAESVDAKHVHDLIMVHDVGEFYDGDISRFVKAGESTNNMQAKFESEARAVSQITEGLAPFQKQWYKDAFDDFENPDHTKRSKESLVANLFESIQGDFTFFDHSELHTREIGGELVTTEKFIEDTRRVVGKYTRPHFVRLIQLFKEESNNRALDDINKLAEAYCQYVRNHANPHVPELAFTTDFLTKDPED